ncbi:hypothetical protein [Pedobacter sp.]|uniref:hypothetical protein n=1 Tax=Pedobacter sp. TaxID=1411316 RepID=UPI003BAA9327
MRNLFYALFLIAICACNNKKPATQITATPTGMQGLQNSMPAQPVSQPIKNNLIFNPAHGQPGHRCDLAVGAPLNQTPSAAQPQQTVSQPTETKVAPAVVKTSAKNLNPAHGQPNHRCDIDVGAPLDSKPMSKQPTVTTVENKTNAATTGVNLNPKHGEPGHRCDIAVGAPLT